ncbi:MAG: PD40 domain-containing protein [Saprospiraceae bacterium]|uniref:PD40 domain-containing protein n=1 Tax=Candidatus Opimibacter skivensis TaxID=2982028 RepID=A0A9D7XRX9_9BACT|nr:PD40 domain-containing protein [Candidatus Opimibacter skivensis]
MNQFSFIVCISIAGIISCKPKTEASTENTTTAAPQDTIHYDQEKHLANVRQLTFGGDNAEAYWSFDSKKLTFQATRKAWNTSCDQIFMIDITQPLDTSKAPQLISTGKGRTTCSYFMPGDTTILYASTHEADAACPPSPERVVGGKYVWPIYPSFDIYIADLKGNIKSKLTNSPGYDAEATVSPKGDKIVFTSIRSGDLEIYTMDMDGSHVHQISHDLGYDGGAFFSPDGSKIVFRASRPTTPEDIKSYKELLAQNLVQPTQMELYVCNTDGSDLHQLTHLGKANWAPYFLPSGDRIIFSSNHAGTKGFEFNLYIIGLDGNGLEQVTYDKVFASFPMFSPDGKKISFSSNRNDKGTHDTNLFVADWVN